MGKIYLGDKEITAFYDSGESSPSNSPVYINKEGTLFRQILNDDFDDGDIDHNIWREDYMPSRVETAYNAYSDVRCEDSLLKVRIKKNMGGRDGTENGSTMAVSTIQSAAWNGMHLPDPTHHYFRPWYGFISQEGYYEIRAKLISGSGTHCAWWMIGTENTSEEMCEFDVFEIRGNDITVIPFNLYPNGDTALTQIKLTHDTNLDLSEDFHTYGFWWENGRLRLYFDDALILDQTCATPQYPMMTFLTAYKRVSGTGWSGDADPDLGDIEMQVDYIKVYKNADTMNTNPVAVMSYDPIELTVTAGDYTVGDYTGYLDTMPLYCYLTWDDGSRTEHWIKWDRFDDTKKNVLDNGGTLEWTGVVYGVGTEITAHITVSAAETA